MDGADGEIQRRGGIEKAVRHVEGGDALPQLRPQAKADTVAQRGLGVLKLADHGRPIVAPLLPGRVVPFEPMEGLHVVREAELIDAQLHGGLRHLRHGVVAVRGDGGVQVVIRDIFPVSHLTS